MAYSEKLADRIRESLADVQNVTEKEMFRGICFMVNDKMCICVSHDELMCRVGPDIYEEALEKLGVRPMMRNGKAISGYLYVREEDVKAKKQFDYWVNACLDFNKEAKSSKKKSPKAAQKAKPTKVAKKKAAKRKK